MYAHGSLVFTPLLALSFLLLPSVFSQDTVTNVTHSDESQKTRRNVPDALPPVTGVASSIDWRFSLGNSNASSTHVGLDPHPPASSPSSPQTPGSSKQPLEANEQPGKSIPWRPEVRTIGDNLAVNLSWPSRSSSQRQLSHYRIQFRHRKPQERRWARPFVVVPTRLSGSVAEPYMYVTNKQPGGLEAGKVYQFQIVAVFVDPEVPGEKSRWSSTVNFNYISPEPPLVRVAQRLPDGRVHLKWSRPWRHNDFKITRFIILFRREKRLPGGETAYHGFQHITAPGNLEEYVVSGLDRNAGYQFVVYGESIPGNADPARSLFTGGLNGRRITAFSQEVFVPMVPTAEAESIANSRMGGSSSSNSGGGRDNSLGLLDMNTNSSNALMFLILGVLAGAMLIVMVFLVAICFFRQHKEKLRLTAQVQAGEKGDRLIRNTSGTDDSNGGGAAPSLVPPAITNSDNTADPIAPKSPVIKPAVHSGGFLLAELTPIAMANFRTAPPPPPTPPPPTAGLAGGAEGATRVERKPLLAAPKAVTSSSGGDADDGGSSSGSANSTPSELFNLAVEREPPSGGSIHEDSDDNADKPLESAARIPIPSNEAVFSPLSLHDVYRPLVRDPHHRRPRPRPLPRPQHHHQLVTRRPPSPALGLGDGGALSRFASHSFGYHHQEMQYQPPQQKRAPYRHSDWLLARAQEGRASSPPQRIQAIVPTGKELEAQSFSRSLTSSFESSPGHRAKSPVGASNERLFVQSHTGSTVGLQAPVFSPLTAKMNSAEQADAYTPTTVMSDHRVSAPASKKRRLSKNSPVPLPLEEGERETRPDFVSAESRVGDLNRR